jgi:hypothetical protein
MTAYLADGWLRVPYSGGDLQRVAIAAGSSSPQAFQGAYLDWDNGQRVAQIRPVTLGAPAGTMTVWLSVDDVITDVGRVDF